MVAYPQPTYWPRRGSLTLMYLSGKRQRSGTSNSIGFTWKLDGFLQLDLERDAGPQGAAAHLGTIYSA